MLVNPGGSGLVYSILGQFVPNGAGNTYDWIGFDPRGVGASRPSLSCIPDYFGYNRPHYIPVTPGAGAGLAGPLESRMPTPVNGTRRRCCPT
jgi:pimeloyl-ACP methyl ester carboxylesterase